MSTTRTRVCVREKSSIKYGRKITRVHVGRTKETFQIHEDLLCATSPFFKQKLQEKRKPVEGDCPICYAELQPERKEITFCSSECGTNIHHDCMVTWQNEESRNGQTVRCPMCRSNWLKHKDLQICNVPELSATGFDIYAQWIYDRKIQLSEKEENHSMDSDYASLVDAYVLGAKIEAVGFRQAILESFLELFHEIGSYPGGETITRAYEATSEPSAIRRLMVGIYLTISDHRWFMDEDWAQYPREFLKDLTLSLMKKHPGTYAWDFDEMLEEYGKEHEEQDGAEDDIDLAAFAMDTDLDATTGYVSDVTDISDCSI